MDCSTLHPNCVSCQAGGDCLSCDENAVYDASAKTCRVPAANCTANNPDNVEECVTCLAPLHYLKTSDKTCLDCSESKHANCTAVDNDGTITACGGSDGTQIPQADGSTCVEPSPDCTDYNTSDVTKCENCTSPFFYLDSDQCSDC